MGQNYWEIHSMYDKMCVQNCCPKIGILRKPHFNLDNSNDGNLDLSYINAMPLSKSKI